MTAARTGVCKDSIHWIVLSACNFGDRAHTFLMPAAGALTGLRSVWLEESIRIGNIYRLRELSALAGLVG